MFICQQSVTLVCIYGTYRVEDTVDFHIGTCLAEAKNHGVKMASQTV